MDIFFPVQELATNLEDVKNELKVTKKKNAAHLKVGVRSRRRFNKIRSCSLSVWICISLKCTKYLITVNLNLSNVF